MTKSRPGSKRPVSHSTVYLLLEEHIVAETEVWQRFEDKLDGLIAALVGSPDKPDNPGFFERVRNLERAWASVGKLMWTAATAAIGAIVAAIASWWR